MGQARNMRMAGSIPIPERAAMNFSKTSHVSKTKLVLSMETLRWLSLSNTGPDEPQHRTKNSCCEQPCQSHSCPPTGPRPDEGPDPKQAFLWE
jgi:hypothetical protein